MARLHLDDWSIDPNTGAVEGHDGARPRLSERELEVLRLLAASPGEVIARDVLGGAGGSRAADMAVSRLRRRLGAAGAGIVTVRGLGYRLDADAGEGLDLGWGTVELSRRRVRLRDREVALTGMQARLLERLCEQPGRPVERDVLARQLWGRAGDLSRLDLLVHRLRQRLEADPRLPRFLVSLRGRGLVLLDARPARGLRAARPVTVPLVGRDAELERAQALLESEGRTLIHGPPGIGKSALAAGTADLWLGRDERRSHAPVDLHGIHSEAEADGRLATALGMESVARDDVVIRSLAARGELLLLLDGALPEGLADRLTGWLKRTPSVRALVATRDALPGWPVIELGGLAPAAARTLLERAAGQSLGEGTERICRRLDGNPLALELVGTGLKHASLADLDRRLAMPLTALRRAWKACLEELPEAQRDVALVLSLFRRPFELADVAALAGIDPSLAAGTADRLLAHSVLQGSPDGRMSLPHAARELLLAELRGERRARTARGRYQQRCRDVLQALVHAIPGRGGPALDDLEGRWPDLERSFFVGRTGPASDPLLLARLAREAAERVPRARRDDWADSLALAAERTDLPGGDRAACLQAVHSIRWAEQSRTERIGLLRRALELAVQGDATLVAASVAGELASVVAFSFGIAEARQILRRHPLPDDAPVAERIRRYRHEGRLGVFAGRPTLGLNRLQEAVDLAEQAGLPLLEAHGRMALGAALSAGTLGQEAEHHLRRAIALTSAHALPEQHVRATLRLGQHLLRLGLRTDAGQLLDDALGAAVRAGLTRLEEQIVGTLGYLLIGERRFHTALTHLDRAVELCREHGGKRGLYVALCNRGLALALAGRPGDARVDLTDALGASGGGAGWYGALGTAYQAVAQLLDEDRPACAASAAAGIGLLTDLEHPHAEPLTAALQVLRQLAEGELTRAEAAAWVAGWDGGAEVEGVVMGIEEATGGYKQKG